MNTLKYILDKKKISMHKLSVLTEIPYSTIKDLVNGNVDFRKTRIETVYKICSVIDIKMETLYEKMTQEKT